MNDLIYWKLDWFIVNLIWCVDTFFIEIASEHSYRFTSVRLNITQFPTAALTCVYISRSLLVFWHDIWEGALIFSGWSNFGTG